VSRAAVVCALLTAVLACSPATGAQDWQTLTTARQHAGEDALSVDLHYAAGRLNIGPGDPGTLYRARLHYDAARVEPVSRYAAGRLTIGIETVMGWRRGGSAESGELDLRLSPEIPLDLQLKFGATAAELDLGGLRLRSAEIATGASETNVRFSAPNPERMARLDLKAGAAAFRAHRLANANAERIHVSGGVGDMLLDFSGTWQGDAAADISMGIGALTLRLPRELGVRLSRRAVLSSFQPVGFVNRDGVYYTDNWDAAPFQLTLDVSSALGSVEIQWVE
jgi:hypothetical protein